MRDWDSLVSRQRDLLVAEHLAGWRWTAGDPPYVADPCPQQWFLPPGWDVADVASGEWIPATWVPYVRGDGHDAEADTSEVQRLTLFGVPRYTEHMAAAWEIVGILRDQWTATTEGTTAAAPDFVPPFDAGAFLAILHRHSDRRWPEALFSLTPEHLCYAALPATKPTLFRG